MLHGTPGPLTATSHHSQQLCSSPYSTSLEMLHRYHGPLYLVGKPQEDRYMPGP